MSVNVVTQKDSKIQHFHLNLDYLANENVENWTNSLINRKINNVMRQYSKNFRTKKFILEFNDDLVSLIAYNILNRLSDISDFSFYIFGKAKRTKNYIYKKDKKNFISLRKIRKIKDQCIYVSVFNFIYNVIPQKRKFNNLGISLGIDTIDLMRDFTPQELFTAQQFYGIGYINDGFYYKNLSLSGYNNWVENPCNYAVPPMVKFENQIKGVQLVYLDGNMNNNVEVLRQVEQTDDVVMFFTENEEVTEEQQKLLSSFAHWVKMKSNIPKKEYMNLNNYNLANAFCHDYTSMFIGNWTTRQKEVFNV